MNAQESYAQYSPDEIVDGHGFVRVRGIDEVELLGALMSGVPDREKPVGVAVVRHGTSGLYH